MLVTGDGAIRFSLSWLLVAPENIVIQDNHARTANHILLVTDEQSSTFCGEQLGTNTEPSALTCDFDGAYWGLTPESTINERTCRYGALVYEAREKSYELVIFDLTKDKFWRSLKYYECTAFEMLLGELKNSGIGVLILDCQYIWTDRQGAFVPLYLFNSVLQILRPHGSPASHFPSVQLPKRIV